MIVSYQNDPLYTKLLLRVVIRRTYTTIQVAPPKGIGTPQQTTHEAQRLPHSVQNVPQLILHQQKNHTKTPSINAQERIEPICLAQKEARTSTQDRTAS